MAFSSGSTLQQTDEVAAVGGGTAPAVGGGGGVSTWDDLSGELSGPVPFDATDDSGNPTSRSLQFLNVTPQVDVTSDPANGVALEIKDQTNGQRLGTLTTDGRWETRADQEAFADGSFGSGSSTNSLLQVKDAGTVLTTDAASLNFTGSGLSLTQNGDEITIDVSGGSGSDIDIEQNQTSVVGGATGLSFEGSGIDSVDNDGDGTATVNISKGSSTEVQEGGTAQVSDVTVLDFVGPDFSVATPTSGEAKVSLQNDTVTVAGNAVSLGGSTGIAHGDLSSIGSSDHHTKTTSAADLTDVSADSVANAHHAVFEPADYNPVSDVEAHGNALAIDISGDADSVDGYQGSELAALAENEEFTNGLNITGGNVGIGTTSPNAALDVYNPTNSPGEHGLVASAKYGAGNTYIARFDYRRPGDSNYDTRMVVRTDGNVGIGTTSPSYTLEVNGDARATGEIEAFLGSDRRLKTRLDPLDSALDKVDQLTGYGFDWREGDAVQPHKRGEKDVGLIAQEVEGVLPEAVKTFSDGHSEGYKSVSYDKLVPLLVEAIKDLRSQLQEVK